MDYLFWGYTVIWGLLFGYVIYLDFRERTIQTKLNQLEMVLGKK
ncbi:MAG TPA: CcmD family protein [Desulfosporosinus sp.]|nr:CcmD family protein [Desulfosporosinus sp.]